MTQETRQGPLDSWLDAGYMPGMVPAEVEAVEAGGWLVRQIHWPKRNPRPSSILTTGDTASRASSPM